MSDKCEADIIVNKNEFYLGEKVGIKIICNNLKCDKAVKSFKLKIVRKYIGLDTRRMNATEDGAYLVQAKLPGCLAKCRIERDLEIDLPAPDVMKPIPIWSKEECMRQTRHPERVGTSQSGCIFNVDYVLNVFIKHDSWNEFGEGNCVAIPIKIRQPPILAAYDQVTPMKPNDWNPEVHP